MLTKYSGKVLSRKEKTKQNKTKPHKYFVS
jgi:hypothetical protein